MVSPKLAEAQAKRQTNASMENVLASFPSMKYQSLMTVPCNTSVVITVTKPTKAVMPASVSVSGKSSTSNYMNINNNTIMKIKDILLMAAVATAALTGCGSARTITSRTTMPLCCR